MTEKDFYRPGWHFAAPYCKAIPGDPNGAFFADGIYHLMFLYFNDKSQAYHWGHLTSKDLLHWERHADALTQENIGAGAFSGGAFLDKDGAAYLTFWKFPAPDGSDSGGIALAKATSPYEEWSLITPIALLSGSEKWGITALSIDGKTHYVGCADPSNIWREGDIYYMQTGNLPVLRKYGTGENAEPQYVGDYTDLFCSENLVDWHYVHRFYFHNGLTDVPEKNEDDMCPQFLPIADKNGSLTGKYLQTFISHDCGGQYYIGRWDKQKEEFFPETHGRFTWNDRTCFAPEALLDDRNRQIIWFWLVDNLTDDFGTYGWSGVYTFPRHLWLQNGELRMAPVEELTALQSDYKKTELSLSNETQLVAVADGTSFRLQVTVSGNAEQIGFAVRVSETEKTEIYYDRTKQRLVMDTRQCGAECWKTLEEAPFALRAGESLCFDILVDRSVVEVFLNERQAISRRIYPQDSQAAVGVLAFARGGEMNGVAETWKIADTNQA